MEFEVLGFLWIFGIPQGTLIDMIYRIFPQAELGVLRSQDRELEVEAEAEAATVAPRPAMVSGKARRFVSSPETKLRLVETLDHHGLEERLAQRYGKKPPKAAVEAWNGQR